VILDAITQALTHHKRAHVGKVGDLCTCGALNPPGDHDRHVAKQVMAAIQDLAGDDAA
jgi:hypothetical protein